MKLLVNGEEFLFIDLPEAAQKEWMDTFGAADDVEFDYAAGTINVITIPKPLSVAWGTEAPANQEEIRGTVTFSVDGSQMANVELVPDGKYDPKYGKVILLNSRSAVVDFDTTKIPDGDYTLELIAYDKPAGQPANEARALQRVWYVRNSHVDVPESPPVISPPETIPPLTIAKGTGPTVNLTDSQPPQELPDAPKDWERWVYDDFSFGKVLWQKDNPGHPRHIWRPELCNFARWHASQGEQQCYGFVGFNPPGSPGPQTYDPFTVGEVDGKTCVTITARPTPAGLEKQAMDQPFQSGVMSTFSRVNQQYGLFEARAMTADEDGTWSAFWTLYGNPSAVPPVVPLWPDEDDIFEAVKNSKTFKDNPSNIHFAAHWRDTNKRADGTLIHPMAHASKGDYVKTAKPWTQWTLYSYLRMPNFVAWYLDRKLAYWFPNPTGLNVEGLRRPVHPIFDLAMGGNWPGPVNAARAAAGAYRASFTDLALYRLPS